MAETNVGRLDSYLKWVKLGDTTVPNLFSLCQISASLDQLLRVLDFTNSQLPCSLENCPGIKKGVSHTLGDAAAMND